MLTGKAQVPSTRVIHRAYRKIALNDLNWSGSEPAEPWSGIDGSVHA